MDKSAMKLLAVNQSTLMLFRDLVDAFGHAGADVKLVAGFLGTKKGYKPKFEWIPACRLEKVPAWRRIWTWGRFTWQVFWAMGKYRDHLALLTTNPPMVPWVAPLAKYLFGVRYAVLVYDIYPDVMVRMGMIRGGGLMDRVMRQLAGISHRKAECIITLGDRMRQTVLGHLRPGDHVQVHVIPNWADVEFIVPIPKDQNAFVREFDLLDKFVIMYSGAFGATHDIESIIDAADILQDLPGVRFVLIGGGTRAEHVHQLVEDRSLPNLILAPWQPLEKIPLSLTSADCHIVSLDVGYEGISVPSKTYSSLAAGAAILAISPPDTELTELVERHKCGVWVKPRNGEDLARVIRELHEDRQRLEKLRANARLASETYYNTRVCTRKYLEILGPKLTHLTVNR